MNCGRTRVSSKYYFDKNVKKYNVDNFLLQLVAVGVAKIKAPNG